MLFEENLEMWELFSEYLLFCDSMKKYISYEKCDDVENPISVDMKRTK